MHDNGMSKTFWDARAPLPIHGIMVHHTDVASRVVDTAIQHTPSVGLLLNLWTVIKRSCTLGVGAAAMRCHALPGCDRTRIGSYVHG